MVFGFGKKKKQGVEDIPDITRDQLGLDLQERSEDQPPIGAPPGFGMEGFSQQQGMQQPQQVQQPQQMQQPQHERDYEVLNAKIDALKAILDSINQRLENIERIARGDHEKYHY